MLATVKVYISSLVGFFLKRKEPSGKKKPPAHKRNKHLRRKKPGVFSTIWNFCSKRIGWKGLALAFGLWATIITGLLYLAYQYSPIDALPITDFKVQEPQWEFPAYQQNDILHRAKRILAVQKLWPTAVESDKRNNLYVATYNGIIVKIEPSESGIMGEGRLEIIHQGVVANVTLPDELIGSYNGRPVGLRFAEGTGLLFVLDSIFGLYVVSTITKITSPLLPISTNGTGMMAPTSFAMHERSTDIYITDFSRKWNDFFFMNQILEGNCTGRLLKFDFGTGDLETMIDRLCAPVGVETTGNSTMVLVTEAQKPRIRVVQLNTTSSIKYTPLAGFPGKPRRNPRGGVWLPVTLINKGFFDMVNPRPWLRRILGAILPPGYLKELATERYTIIFEVDPLGQLVDSIQDPGEKKVYEVSEVKEGTKGQLIIISRWIERLTKLVGEGNEGESKTPVAPEEEEEDEITRTIRQQQEEMEQEKERVFDPEPDGDVSMKLIKEHGQSFADDAKEIRAGWYAKPKPAGDSASNENTAKKEL